MNKAGIILGSSSKIREMILKKSTFKFKIHSPNIDETLYEHLVPIKKVKEIALEKNKKIANLEQYKNSIIITADTLCLLPSGDTLQKPRNISESIEMSMKQSGKTVKAITGLCVSFIKNNKRHYISRYSSTKITYINFTIDDLLVLMRNHEVTNKSSGLGIWNDSIGFSLIRRFNGSYTGALGLPMEIVRKLLQDIGKKS